MTKGVNRIMIMVLVLSGFFVTGRAEAQALAPRLLWEKTMPFGIDDIVMARQSGDVILYSQNARQIILFDKNGHKIFHWGARIDRQPMGVGISDDGNTIVFTSLWTETYVEKKRIDINRLGWDNRVHYLTRKGKELWNKQIQGSAFLSPNGSLVAVVGEHGMGGVPLTVLDSKGNMLWKYPTGPVFDLQFSPDGNHILFHDGALHLFDKTGNLLWKKPNGSMIDSVSEDAAYITTRDEKVYDKQGNILLTGDALISNDGKRLLVKHPDRTIILTMPEKSTIKEYPFSPAGFLSYHDGLFLARKVEGGLLIVDTINELSSKISVEGSFRIEATKNGKYLIVTLDKKKILFYQVY